MREPREGYSQEASEASPAPRCQAETLRASWADFLAELGPWEWFGTFTFRDYVHPERADKLFRLFVSQGNRTLYGPRWYRKGKGLTWVRGLEYQKRSVIHYHALFKDAHGLRRLDLMDWWYDHAGIARIEATTSQEAVRRYVSKYTVKGGEIDLGGPGIPDAPRSGARRWPPGLPWYLTPLGRPEAYAQLGDVTTETERAGLRAWANGVIGRRAAAPLVRIVRERIMLPPVDAPPVSQQVRYLFAEAQRMGRRR